jgi:hypothetical protein
MSQFYVSTENDIHRCKESIALCQPITITGTDMDGRIRVFTGQVQSVEENRQAASQQRSRIKMLEAN